MAVLTDEDRRAIWANLMSQFSARREALAINKAELRAAVNAIDGWVNSTRGAFHAALPGPARTSLTDKQKSELLLFVVRRRWELE